MRRMWIAVIILVLVTSLCVWEVGTVNFMTNNLINSLDLAQNKIEKEDDTIGQLVDDLDEEWREDKKILSIFIPHQRLEVISQSFSEMRVNAKCNEKSDSLAECEKLKVNLEHLRETELVKIQNIL